MPRRRSFGSVRQLASGRWQARYFGPDGIRREAPETFLKERDAQMWLTLREAEIVRGEWMDPDRGRELFGSYAARWIEQQKLGPRTREEYERTFRLHVAPLLGRRELGRIKPDTIRTWRSKLLASGRSEDATAKAYRLVRSVMATAVDDDLIRRNPCRIRALTRHGGPNDW